VHQGESLAAQLVAAAGRPEVADFVAWLREEADKEPR
jgi:hypothetical protein